MRDIKGQIMISNNIIGIYKERMNLGADANPIPG